MEKENVQAINQALPGRRRGGGGLGDTFTTTNAASFGLGGVFGGGKPRSAGIKIGGGTDPMIARRLDSVEQKLNGQDQAHRTLMEQIMKLNQEMKMEFKKKDSLLMEEKTARMRAEQGLQDFTEKMVDMEDRLKHVEQGSRENKNALAQLISHTKNVERAVTMNQQDLLQRKEAQAAKMQDLNHKLTTMTKNRENLERMVYSIRDELSDVSNKVDNQSLEVKDVHEALRLQNKMFDAQASKLKQGAVDNENGQKLSETQKAALEAKIMQLQNAIMDVQTKINHERKEREVDQQTLNTRISECNTDVSEIRRKRDTDLKALEVSTKELATMGDAEKQRIIMQISAVQTELKRTMDERDLKLKESTVQRLEELQKEVKLESKQRLENEKEARLAIEAFDNKMKLYTDETTESVRTMLTTDIEKLRTRIQEINDSYNDLEVQVAQVQSESKDLVEKSNQDNDGKEKLLEAKIEDLGDRLRLGMGKLQQAIGETSASVNGKNNHFDDNQVQLEDAEGIREKIQGDLNEIERQINEIRNMVENQQNVIEQQLRSHQQQGQEASTILGDTLQQKMDSITFTQERMKRHLDDLQEKTQGAPTEIFDMRERMVDVEREFKASVKDRKIVKERLEVMETDVNHIMGRGETSNVSGIPTLSRLLTDIDELNANKTKVTNDFDTFQTTMTEKLVEETKQREDAVEKLKKDQVKSDKRVKALKERIKKISAPAASLGNVDADGPKGSDDVFDDADADEENE